MTTYPITLFVFSFIFQVTDSNRLWGWLRQEFIPNIYNQTWYNGLKEENDVYIGNKMSMLIGMPWMRQLRVKKSKRLVNVIFEN